MICPNRLLGNGIVSFCITFEYLQKNYKRIKKQIALDKYPEFKQYIHSDLVKEGEKLGIDTLKILNRQRF